MTALDFDQVVEQYHLALGELSKGNPEPVEALFSHRVDVSTAGGFGGVMLGWKQVAKNTEFAASRFKRRAGSQLRKRGEVRNPRPGIHRRDRAVRSQSRRNGRHGPSGSAHYKHFSA